MLKENRKIFSAAQQGADLLVISIAFTLAFHIRATFLTDALGNLILDYNYNIIFILCLLCYHISLKLFGGYAIYRHLHWHQLLLRLFQASLTSMAGVIFITYLIHMEGVNRSLLLLFTIFSFVLLALFRFIVLSTLKYNRERNYNTRNLLIIGSKTRANEFIKTVCNQPSTGYRIIGSLETVENRSEIGKCLYQDVSIIGTLEQFEQILTNQAVDEVIFAMPLKKIENIHHYIYFAEEMGVNIKILPDFQLHRIKYLPKTATVSLHDFIDTPVLCLSSLPKKGTQLLFKDVIDYIGAGVGVILLSPIFLAIAFFIKTTSKGPAIFSQPRVGINGRIFHIYKFRSMVVNAEELKESLAGQNEVDGPVFKIRDDPRITTIGKFLRKTSLDELPQLFNVLKGEMSLVGPRPPVPSEVMHYELWQRRRLSMKPGLTCIWQVSGRNNISFEQWMAMDLEYIDRWSLWLDIKLLLKTFKEVTVGGGH